MEKFNLSELLFCYWKINTCTMGLILTGDGSLVNESCGSCMCLCCFLKTKPNKQKIDFAFPLFHFVIFLLLFKFYLLNCLYFNSQVF